MSTQQQTETNRPILPINGNKIELSWPKIEFPVTFTFQHEVSVPTLAVFGALAIAIFMNALSNFKKAN